MPERAAFTTGKKARILIVSGVMRLWLAAFQTVAQNLAKQFLARGHEVRVVTHRYPVALPRKKRSMDQLGSPVFLSPPSIT